MLGTSLLWRSTVAFTYLKVKSTKCLCLLPVLLVFRIWSCLYHWCRFHWFGWSFRCASGCVVECRICNREVAGSNLILGYFAPRSTQPSIPPGSVYEYQLRLGRQRQWLIPTADERVGVQVKLWNPLRTRAIPERFCGGDSLRRGAISSVCAFTLYLYLSAAVSSRAIASRLLPVSRPHPPTSMPIVTCRPTRHAMFSVSDRCSDK